ncbi:MAG: sensor histidine kinase [Bacteroidia bacterium]
MKNQLLKWAIHILFWLGSTWLIVSSFSIQSKEIEITNGIETVRIVRDGGLTAQLTTWILISAVVFYTIAGVLGRLSQGRNWRSAGKWAFAILPVSALGYYLFYLRQNNPAGPILSWQIGVGILGFYVMAAAAYGLFKVWKYAEEQRQKVLLQKNIAELALLRSQLHPHFLFNVLNNLLSMVDQVQNPALASAIDKLSYLLRYVVDETVRHRVPLRKEINFIQSFADLQALRFEKDELTFILETTGDNDSQPIEPGILIPFVENAFKYGTEPEKPATIFLRIDMTAPGKVYIELTNPVNPEMRKTPSGGSGIRSVVERLRIVYPGRHSLMIREDNGLFIVQLEIWTYESNHR